MFQAKHNDDQTEEHIFHNHDNALPVEAAIRPEEKLIIINSYIHRSAK